MAEPTWADMLQVSEQNYKRLALLHIVGKEGVEDGGDTVRITALVPGQRIHQLQQLLKQRV
jgi:hypothetical protein